MPFNRLTASLLLVVVVGVVGLGFLLSELYTVLDGEQNSSDNSAYKALGGQLALTISRADDLSLALEQAHVATGLELSLISQNDLQLPLTLAESLANGQPLLLQREGVLNNTALSVYLSVPQTDQLLIIDGLPVEEVRKADGTRLLLTLTFYAGLLGVVLMWLAPLVRRLSALRQVTRAFGQGDLKQRLSSKGTSYIAAIEADFNQMAEKIQDLMADNRLLSRAVSHDLKTPLARLRFGVEMLSQNVDAEKRQKYSQRVEHDIDEMESLVSTLLDYARMEDSRPTLNFETVDLAVYLPQLLAQNEEKIEINFLSHAARHAEISADIRYLNMLFLNVLNNAFQHALSRIQISVEKQSGRCIVSIEDDGEGIPLDDRTEVLKPFVRLNASKDSRLKGHGMGLAIVQRLAKWHGAQVELSDSSDLGGAKVVVKFPVNQSTEN